MNDSSKRCELVRLRRAAAAWLLARRPKPACLGYDVPTLNGWLKADVVACWLKKRKKKKFDDISDDSNEQSLAELHHAITLCGVTRESCWPECDTAEEIVAEVRKLRQEAELMEEGIRHLEPELRADDVLFEEFAIWEYERSTNQQYQQLRRRVAELEQMLYDGTRLEKLSQRPMAEKMYLITPAGVIQAQELRRDWGLLWVDDNNQVELVREGKTFPCRMADNMKLFQNVLAANMNVVLTLPAAKVASAKTNAHQKPVVTKKNMPQNNVMATASSVGKMSEG